MQGLAPEMNHPTAGCLNDACTWCRPEWANLPEDLIVNFLARLPLHSLFQARVACKNWSVSLLSSGNFLSAHAQASASEAYFPLVATRGSFIRCCAADPVSKAWRELPSFSFMPRISPAFDDYQVLGGHKGLFFVKNGEFYFVTNPLTEACTQLPSVYGGGLTFFSGAVSVQVDPGGKRYRIFRFMDQPLEGKWSRATLPMASSYFDNGFARVQVYDSSTRLWSLLTTGPTFDKAVFASSHAAYHEGTFFLIVCNYHDHKFWMTCFDLETRQWTNHRLPGAVTEKMANLVQFEGQVLLVGWNVELARYLVIYVFMPSSQEWTIVTFMPPYMEDVLDACVKEGVRAVRHGNLLCITTMNSLIVVVYNLRASSWHRWPSPDGRRLRRGLKIGQPIQPLCFPYEPSFAAEV